LRPGPCSLAGSRPKQKRPSRGSPWKAWFSMTAGPLGRFAPLGVVKRARAMVAGRHGSAHTGGRWLDAGQREWPCWR